MVMCILGRSDNKNLKSSNVQLRGQTERYKERCQSMEEKSIQHGELQQKMRDRLRQMDTHAQRSSSQVCCTWGSGRGGDRWTIVGKVCYLKEAIRLCKYMIEK